MALTKPEMIAAVAEQTGFTKADTKLFIETQELVVRSALRDGGECILPGLGKLQTKESSARVGRNPRTGEAVDIPAKTMVKFSAAKALKDAVA